MRLQDHAQPIINIGGLRFIEIQAFRRPALPEIDPNAILSQTHRSSLQRRPRQLMHARPGPRDARPSSTRFDSR